ncbi:MAG TPA: hypothetical protein VHS97_14920, partial [Isosphaeraceae bacterium]|nr:hypothetical protein [Isosphaeraceae bacterium]
QTAKMITIIDPKTPNLDRTLRHRSGSGRLQYRRARAHGQPGVGWCRVARNRGEAHRSAVGRGGPLDPADRSAPPYRFDPLAVNIVSQTRQINPAGLT